MELKEFKVGELIAQIRGITYKKDEISKTPLKNYVALVKANNIKSNFQLDYTDLIYVKKENVKEKQKLRKGDIVIAASSGSIRIVGKGALFNDDLDVTFGAFCKVIRPDFKKINPKLLAFYFQTEYYRKTISNLAQGANINNLKNEHLENLSIKIPTDLELQEQLVAVLDKAQSLIQKREQSLVLLDELLRATFMDMFGDPTNNQKKLPIGIIGDLVENVKYGTSSKAALEGELPYLRMNNLTYAGYLDTSKLKYITFEEKEKIKYSVQKGDILFNRTNSRDLVGKTVVFDREEEMVIAGYIIKSKAKKNANPDYVWGYLNSEHGKLKLKSICKSIVGMANINAKEFQKIPIQLASPKEQNKYGEIVVKIKFHRNTLLNSLDKTHNLFHSLLQKAFSGDLELKDDKVKIQTALEKIKWFDEQMQEISENHPIKQLQKNLKAFNELPSTFNKFANLQKQLAKLLIPNLNKITEFQKGLDKINIPQLKYIKSLDEFNRLKENDFLKKVAEDRAFKIKSFEKFVEAEKEREIEEQLKQENDPVLLFIGKEQIGRFTVDNYKINVARAIHKFFNKREFDLDSLITALKDEEGVINVSKAAVRKDLFRIFKEFINSQYLGKNRKICLFSFNEFRKRMRKDLFNPSFELLKEFIDSEMKAGKITQEFVQSLPLDMSDEYYNQFSRKDLQKIIKDSESRVYLELKAEVNED